MTNPEETQKTQPKKRNFLQVLGPGLITGASDDDPSGIATYTQAGAAFGFATLWTALITFPLMTSIQEMCARIAIITKEGLTGTLKKNYPKSILYLTMVFSFPAIVLNIGADLQGMGAVAHLMVPAIPTFAFSVFFSAFILFVVIKYPYQKLSLIFKWLCITLLLYIVVPFFEKINWFDVVKHTFIPTIHLDKNFFEILVALFGTTISPYLFFWQATMEKEDMDHLSKQLIVNKQVIHEMKKDVGAGMLFSNIVMFFIILSAGAVLFTSGHRQIDTIDEAAKALEPLAGKFAFILFSVGVIGTGILAIPVLAGSLSYILSETLGWQGGLDQKFSQAKGFYVTIIISLAVGLSLNFIGITPIQALIYTAVLYGLTAPVMIAIILHICNNKKIMGKSVNGKVSNILGLITLILMTVSAIALIYFQFT
jgi:NRAMP (natural resistance-associated macrophage protein)-like metal ion transporter